MSLDFGRARQEMVREQVGRRGLKDERLLGVMEEIPRELFLPEHMRGEAYEDRALPIGRGQTISQPYIVGLMTIMLDVQAGHRVLEIGTGSGYQTMILSRLAERVYTVERIGALREEAERVLTSLGVNNVHFAQGDGTLGYRPAAPYDRIMVTAGAPVIPPALVEQLVEGGRMVLPVGPTDRQTLTTVEKQSGRVIETPGIAVRFVKLVGAQGWVGGEGPAPEGLSGPTEV